MSIWIICFNLEDMSRPTVYPVKKLISLTEEQAEQISDYRFRERFSSENEAIRRLIELGLDANETNKDDE